jgi:hypothetical protein
MKPEPAQVIQTLRQRVHLHAIQAEQIHAGKNPRFQGRASAFRLVEQWLDELTAAPPECPDKPVWPKVQKLPEGKDRG